jgi:hypothetical protein
MIRLAANASVAIDFDASTADGWTITGAATTTFFDGHLVGKVT